MPSTVNIYEVDGSVGHVLTLPENVTPVSGRTSIGDSGVYYKGVGSSYVGHSVLDATGYDGAVPSEVFYYGYTVKNSNWENKTGIFKTPLQPYFRDLVGSCGPKELSIVEKSEACPVSAVSVLSVHPIETLQDQYYIKLNYTVERKSWLTYGTVEKLMDAIAATVMSGWCFPWDKAAIKDIGHTGLVTDVADMFPSTDSKHLFGSVYAVLYSLYTIHKPKFDYLVASNNFVFKDLRSIPTIALAMIDRFGVNTDFAFPKGVEDEWDVYYHLVYNCLMGGKNCAHVEKAESGDAVAEQYKAMYRKRLNGENALRLNRINKALKKGA